MVGLSWLRNDIEVRRLIDRKKFDSDFVQDMLSLDKECLTDMIEACIEGMTKDELVDNMLWLEEYGILPRRLEEKPWLKTLSYKVLRCYNRK